MARAKELGFHGVDYVNSFFKDKAGDRAYLADMKKRSDAAGLENDLILIDGEGMLGDPDPAARSKAVDNHKPWVEAAKALGCHAIRINAASRGKSDEQQKLVVDGMRASANTAIPRASTSSSRTTAGCRATREWLESVVRGVKHPRCGSLPTSATGASAAASGTTATRASPS